MPRLRINHGQSFKIHGRQMKVGDEFDCTETEAVIWRGKGWASDAPKASDAVRTNRGRYARADMRAEDQD